MKEKIILQLIIISLMLSCKKNKECENCKYISNDQIHVFTIDSFNKYNQGITWCTFLNKYDTIQFTDPVGNVVADGIKTCN